MTHRVLTAFVAILLAGVGCRTASVENEQTPPSQTSAATPTTVPEADQLPSGTPLHVRLEETLSTEKTTEGSQFNATLVDPIETADGQTVVPAGAGVSGQVTGLTASSGANDQAAIRLDIQQLSFNDHTYHLPARITQTDVQTSRDKSDLGTGAAIGGVAGAALGAVIGESVQGALLGGVLGAGAGTVVSLGVGTTNAKLEKGSKMTLQTTEAVDLAGE